MAQPEPKLQCICCTDPGTLTCTGCRDAKYCSRECQEADHQFHKYLCKSFARFQPEHRPSPEMRRVVHFPACRDKPEFRWLPVTETFGPEDFEDTQTVDHKTITGGKGHFLEGCMMNEINGAELGGIVMISCYDGRVGEFPENKAIITATNSKANLYPWTGPMIGICGTKKYTNQEYVHDGIGQVDDMNMRAYSFLMIRMISRRNITDEHKLRCGPKVEAAKIISKCLRDPDTPLVQAVKLPRMHPLFEEPSIPAFTKGVEFPLLTMKSKDKSSGSRTLISDEAAALHLVIDPYSLDLNHPVPLMASGGIDDVYLARVDRSPLIPDTAEAFIRFSHHVLAPFLPPAVSAADGDSTSTIQEKQDKALQQITPEKWTMYLAGWKAKKASDKVGIRSRLLGGGNNNGNNKPFVPFLGFKGQGSHGPADSS